jgi:hypothetical protein
VVRNDDAWMTDHWPLFMLPVVIGTIPRQPPAISLPNLPPRNNNPHLATQFMDTSVHLSVCAMTQCCLCKCR